MKESAEITLSASYNLAVKTSPSFGAFCNSANTSVAAFSASSILVILSTVFTTSPAPFVHSIFNGNGVVVEPIKST